MFKKADRDGDGKLTKDDWFRVLNSSGCPATMWASVFVCFGVNISFYKTREEVDEFFEKMDRDFDGKLSFEEFMGEETALERLFQSMDKDGDGTVTKEVCCIFYNLL